MDTSLSRLVAKRLHEVGVFGVLTSAGPTSKKTKIWEEGKTGIFRQKLVSVNEWLIMRQQ